MKLVKIIKSVFRLIGLFLRTIFNICIILLSLFNVASYRFGFKRGYNKAQLDKYENIVKRARKNKIEYDIKPKLVKL